MCAQLFLTQQVSRYELGTSDFWGPGVRKPARKEKPGTLVPVNRSDRPQRGTHWGTHNGSVHFLFCTWEQLLLTGQLIAGS